MIPAPSKRPFGFPLQPEVLPFFCHPWLKPFAAPVRHPADGLVYAASGYVALRVRRGHWFAEEYPEATPEFIERTGSLPWHWFEPQKGIHAVPKWRAMDDSRGTIYRGEVLDLWDKHAKPNLEPLVMTCNGPLIPLALLQLLARLPRCEVRMTAGQVPLLFRFTGGEGIVANLFKGGGILPTPKFELFKQRDTSNDLSNFTF